MGREVRRVPPNWDHPTTEYGSGRNDRSYQPMHDEPFEPVYQNWLKEFDRVRAGDLTEDEKRYWPNGIPDWLRDEGHPPHPDFYRPWKDEDATWYQAWETVSEGTPVSPPFATEDELIDYLATHGDFWDQKRGTRPPSRESAEAFVRGGWAPSFVAMGGRVMSGIDALPELAKREEGT